MQRHANGIAAGLAQRGGGDLDHPERESNRRYFGGKILQFD